MKRASSQELFSGSVEEMAEQAARLIIAEAHRAVAARGIFTLVLAGGSSPRPLYRLLASGTGQEALPWEHTRLFMGDERCVPAGSPDSNFRMIEESLFSTGCAPKSHCFRMEGELPDPAEGAGNYETAIRTFFTSSGLPIEDGFPLFDIILLGLGEDGHTASLFPGNPEVLKERERWVVALDAPNGKPPGKRLSVTLPVINHARCVVFITSGREKALLAAKIARGECSELPAALVAPQSGRLFWFTAQP